MKEKMGTQTNEEAIQLETSNQSSDTVKHDASMFQPSNRAPGGMSYTSEGAIRITQNQFSFFLFYLIYRR